MENDSQPLYTQRYAELVNIISDQYERQDLKAAQVTRMIMVAGLLLIAWSFTFDSDSSTNRMTGLALWGLALGCVWLRTVARDIQYVASLPWLIEGTDEMQDLPV